MRNYNDNRNSDNKEGIAVFSQLQDWHPQRRHTVGNQRNGIMDKPYTCPPQETSQKRSDARSAIPERNSTTLSVTTLQEESMTIEP